MAESTAQSLRRRPFEVSERVEHVAHVEIWPACDDCVSAPPQRLHALGPSPLLCGQLGELHRPTFSRIGFDIEALVRLEPANAGPVSNTAGPMLLEILPSVYSLALQARATDADFFDGRAALHSASLPSASKTACMVSGAKFELCIQSSNWGTNGFFALRRQMTPA
jgi:hypothetical protein